MTALPLASQISLYVLLALIGALALLTQGWQIGVWRGNALYGLFTRHWISLLGAPILFKIYAYYGLGYFLRRDAIRLWRLGDRARWCGVAVGFSVVVELPRLLGLFSPWSKWRYFLE